MQKINKTINLILHFGIPLVYYNIMKSIFRRGSKLNYFFNRKKHKVILNILIKKYNHLFDKYRNIKTLFSPIPKIIWICWWDGIQNMPPIIKACYNSIKKYASDYEINLITKFNYTEFLCIPNQIIKKVEDKIITITHLSDIIRMNLLSNHGGFWLDATVLVTSDIFIDKYTFFTIKRKPGGIYVPNGKWAGNCIAGSKDNPLFNFIYEFFIEYWNTNNIIIDNFLIDYAIKLAYDNIPYVTNAINDLLLNNEKYMSLSRNLHFEYSSDFFNEVIKDTSFHKLTWKVKYSNYTKDNKLTLYGYIIQEYA